MLPQELIDGDLGHVLYRLGYTVSNSALYLQELGENVPTEEQILTEWEVVKQERYILEQQKLIEEAIQKGYKRLQEFGYSAPIRELIMSLLAADMLDENKKNLANSVILKIKNMLLDASTNPNTFDPSAYTFEPASTFLN